MRGLELIRTKLRLPFIRAGLVSRPRLQEQVLRGLCGPLILITAPAGFGKTTLLSEWIEHQARQPLPMQFAWLSLDANDNDPARFVAYLVGALQKLDPIFGEEILPVLWEDNCVTLLPGETRTLTATYRTRDLGGAPPSVVVKGWNVRRAIAR